MAGRVAIVTDSAANLPAQLRADLGITVVPVLLEREGVLLRDEVDVASADFYGWMRDHPAVVTRTASPSVGDFLQVFKRLMADHDAVVSVHVAADLSATWAAADEAARMIGTARVGVVDSRTASMGLGFAVLEAARAAADGAETEVVRARAEEIARRVQVYVVLDTLRYIHHSGRAPAIAGMMGSVIKVRPLLRVGEGKVQPVGLRRTVRGGMRSLAAAVERGGAGETVHLAVMHGDAESRAEELKTMILESIRCAEVHVVQFTPVMGAATGPGLLGVAFYAD